jgi:hypothetical protein
LVARDFAHPQDRISSIVLPFLHPGLPGQRARRVSAGALFCIRSGSIGSSESRIPRGPR